MDKNAKRLLDIIRNSNIDTSKTTNIGNSSSEQNLNIPHGIENSEAQQAPINVRTANPGSRPLIEPPVPQEEQEPTTGQVTMPGDVDFQTKVNALKRFRGQGG